MKKKGKKIKTVKNYNFYRNYGDISNDSVITDIYKKRVLYKINRDIRRGKKPKQSKCVTRQATPEEREKYGIVEV